MYEGKKQLVADGLDCAEKWEKYEDGSEWRPTWCPLCSSVVPSVGSKESCLYLKKYEFMKKLKS